MRKVPWTQERVIRWLLKINAKTQYPLTSYVMQKHPDLLEAAEQLFGSWEKALIAARIICPPTDPDMFYDTELGIWAHDSLTSPIDRHPFLEPRPSATPLLAKKPQKFSFHLFCPLYKG